MPIRLASLDTGPSAISKVAGNALKKLALFSQLSVSNSLMVFGSES